MSYSPYPAPSTLKTRKPRPKPRPIKALGDIDHYPARDHPLPANISCRDICRNYPNHLREEVLEDFIYWKWSARQIFDALLPDAQVQMSQNHTATNRNRNPSNVIAKRLEKRRSRYVRAGGLEQIMNRQNVRPHGMGPNWSGIHRDPKPDDQGSVGGPEDMVAAVPITPATSTIGLANPDYGTGFGFGFVNGGVLQLPHPVHAGSVPKQSRFNGRVGPVHQSHVAPPPYQDNMYPHLVRQPPAPALSPYGQEPAYGDTYKSQGGGYGFDAPGTWNGDDAYVSTMPRGNHGPDDMYDDDNKWSINNNGIDLNLPGGLPGGYEYFGPTHPQQVQPDDGYQYPDPEPGEQAAPAYPQNDPYAYPMTASQVDHQPQVFDTYADPYPAPQAARYGYHYPDPAQGQDNVNYRDLLDCDFDEYDDNANGNGHRDFEHDGFGGN